MLNIGPAETLDWTKSQSCPCKRQMGYPCMFRNTERCPDEQEEINGCREGSGEQGEAVSEG